VAFSGWTSPERRALSRRLDGTLVWLLVAN